MSSYKPENVITLPSGEAVKVREMAWEPAMDFLTFIGKAAAAYLAVRKQTTNAGEIPKIPWADWEGTLKPMILQSRELCNHLLYYSVKNDDGSEFLHAARPFSEVLIVLGAALEINTSPAVAGAIENLSKKVIGVVGGMAGTTTPTTKPATLTPAVPL
jgi:hypothetical protein